MKEKPQDACHFLDEPQNTGGRHFVNKTMKEQKAGLFLWGKFGFLLLTGVLPHNPDYVMEIKMGRGYLKEEEIEELKKNPYVLDADNTRIIYTPEYKKLFMREYLAGKKPKKIFEDAGFDIRIIGPKRIERASARWREVFRSGGEDAFDQLTRRKNVRTKRTQLLQDVERFSHRLTQAEIKERASREAIEDLNREIERLRALAGRLYAENRELKDQIAQAEINGYSFEPYKNQLYSVM